MEYPVVRRRIKRAVELLRGCPIDAVYLTGGIVLGAYSPAMSDIDLVVVLSPTSRAGTSAKAAVLAVADDLPPVAMLLVGRDQLSAAEPKALQVEGSWSREYTLHAMDVILLRDYSVLLFGTDCRSEMAPYAASEVIGSIIGHVANAMLPGAIAAVTADPALPLDRSNIVGLVFLMARCLVTLHTGQLVDKPTAARWLQTEARCKPHLVPLATMASRFTLWYRRGMPKTVRSRRINTHFQLAVAGFLSECQSAASMTSVP